jgi:ferredoxin
MNSFGLILDHERRKQRALATGQVAAYAVHCVQCGICAYNCPAGIDIRAYTWRGRAVDDDRCIMCGECVARCPRGVLHFRAASVPL